MTYKLVLSSGEEIRLTSYHQDPTYWGLLEGLPLREDNLNLLERLKQPGDELPVLLLEPEQVPIKTASPYPFGEPARLPEILCISRWIGPVADKCMDYSALKIIWFQSDFGLPEAHIEEQLKQMEWHRHSKDFLW